LSNISSRAGTRFFTFRPYKNNNILNFLKIVLVYDNEENLQNTVHKIIIYQESKILHYIYLKLVVIYVEISDHSI
jgi:hypothetical protein